MNEEVMDDWKPLMPPLVRIHVIVDGGPGKERRYQEILLSGRHVTRAERDSYAEKLVGGPAALRDGIGDIVIKALEEIEDGRGHPIASEVAEA